MRTKNVILILVAVLTVVLGALAFLIGMMLGGKPDGSTQTAEQTVTTAAETEPVTETKAVTTLTTATETTAEKTAETRQETTDASTAARTETQPPAVPVAEQHEEPQADAPVQQEQQPANDPNTAALRSYAGILRNFMNGSEYSASSRYDLFDITQDGVPELFVSVNDHSNPNEWRNGTVKIYTYTDGGTRELTAAIVNDYDWNGRSVEAYMLGFDGVLYLRSGSGVLKSHDTSYGGSNSVGYRDTYFEYQSDGCIHWAGDLMYDSMSGYASASGTSGAAVSEAEFNAIKQNYEGSGNLLPVGRQYYFPQSSNDWSYVGDTFVG